MADLTPNQVVAFRLNHARQLNGWTQDQAARRLEPFLGERWSRVVFSAAERSVTSGRVRQFTADHLLAFAEVFDLPVAFFLTPPPEAQRIAARGAPEGLSRERVMDLVRGDADAKIDARVDALLRATFERAVPGLDLPSLEASGGWIHDGAVGFGPKPTDADPREN